METPLVIPAIATLALAAAVFVPLRDRRPRQVSASPAIDPAPIVTERSFADEVAALLPTIELAPSVEAPLPAVASAPLPASPLVLERAVPITRLPLRARPPVAWAADVWPPIETTDVAARHAFLRRAGGDGEDGDELLARAFREEDAEGRLLALTALLQHPWSSAARATFSDAMRAGGDEERALAIDGIVANGDRSALTMALGDRLEAIAARAALALVDGESRDDYRRELAPLVEPERLEAILRFLAGVLA